ncbi:MAG: DUF721 domain-containing protein [Candidatus Margulisbacteria bacterium]|nr:DUF721 domain-containing protein [Candidatus Margulisiibacteriota bacterium]
MQNLGHLLKKKFRGHFRYTQALQLIQDRWPSLVKNLSNCLYPKNIHKNELVIECNNPVWMSEIDCFKQDILSKVNQLLSTHSIKVTLVGIKPLVNANFSAANIIKKTPHVPGPMMDRICWNIKNKQKSGAILCKSCKKVWDKYETCRLCQLTGD